MAFTLRVQQWGPTHGIYHSVNVNGVVIPLGGGGDS